jgi:hypothetical protein
MAAVVAMNPTHATERSDTYSVSIAAPPPFVWSILSNVEDWAQFSPFAQAVARTSATSFVITSPQGAVLLTTNFDEPRLLLDHTVTLSDQTEVFIAYRVTPNHLGSELMMTNVKSPSDSDTEYDEQLAWMRDELEGAKRFVEDRYSR